MNNDKKIKLQQSIIEDLQAENQQLRTELENLKLDIDFERSIKDKEYDEIKDLMIELNKEKAIYEDLIQKAIMARNKYKEQEKEMKDLKVKYHKEMKAFMKDIKSIM